MESFDGNGGCWLVVTELSHIKDLVMQLEVHLDGSPDLCRHLTAKIFSHTERSIGIITSSNFESGRKRAADAETPRTPSIKKRKMMEKVKNQVRMSSGSGGGETPVDDGHSWRKYGQKEILGAKYPRAYYRCTHRHSQGCAATKQMQRTDEDPALFDVFYVGTHTCVLHKTKTATATHEPEGNPDARSLLENLSSTSLTVNTEGLEPQGCSTTTPFSFPSTPSTSTGTWAVTPATSDSNNDVASFSPFEWGPQSAELHEVVSALVAASTPSVVPAVDIADEFLDMDAISSFFA